MPRSSDDSTNPRGGIYRKFTVMRTDGASEPGGKHEHCHYFVLDWIHDKYAVPAALAYADACEAEYPELARDLRFQAHNAPWDLAEIMATNPRRIQPGGATAGEAKPVPVPLAFGMTMEQQLARVDQEGDGPVGAGPGTLPIPGLCRFCNHDPHPGDCLIDGCSCRFHAAGEAKPRECDHPSHGSVGACAACGARP